MGKYADLVAQYKQEQQTQKAKQLSAPLRGAVSAANSAMLNWGDEVIRRFRCFRRGCYR